jgi:hypothetical protein
MDRKAVTHSDREGKEALAGVAVEADRRLRVGMPPIAAALA